MLSPNPGDDERPCLGINTGAGWEVWLQGAWEPSRTLEETRWVLKQLSHEAELALLSCCRGFRLE